jgi:SAM-dependent methyltransferase
VAVSKDDRKNRTYWDRTSDEYQEKHGPQLTDRPEPGWGVWEIPERELRILGEVRGRDVLELGCGAGQWSIHLAMRGAHPVGLDGSKKQLGHARRLMAEAGVDFPLVHGIAERIPLASGRFDIVFCDHGAMSFADPERTLPEVARVLRPGGLLAFNMASPLMFVCWSDRTERVEKSLQIDYFGMRRWEGNTVEFQLQYGEWIRRFRKHGFVVEDLVELQPPVGATTTYDDYVSLQWARRWPAENIWKVRKEAALPAAEKG